VKSILSLPIVHTFPRWWRKPDYFYPLLLLLVIIAYYGVFAGPNWITYRFATWDSLRDAINARHLLEGGGLLADPVLSGYHSWYPPTHAALMAGYASLFHADLIKVYAIFTASFNWIAILAFYFLSYRLTNRNPHAAFAATLSLCALPWFVTYVMASPTVMAHASALSLILLAAFVFHADALSYKTISVFALCCGAMGLFHPPTFLIILGAFSLFWFIRIRHSFFAWDTILHAALFTSIALAVASPYWLTQILQPVRNPDPIGYIAPALYHLEFILPGKSLIRCIPIMVLALAGLCLTLKRRHQPVYEFLLALLGISIIGQIPPYLLKYLQNTNLESYNSMLAKLPVLVPHEFQLYTQLAAALFAGIGLSWFLDLQIPLKIRYLICSVLIIALSASLLVCLTEIPQHSKLFLWPYHEKGEWDGVSQFIRQNTNVNDVICSPDDHSSFFVIGVRTGRKTLHSYPSHCNPRADMESRRQARDNIYYTAEKDSILQYARTYNIRYLLVSRKLVDPNRIKLFQKWFNILYDDDIVALVELI
jgi:hypothetical protein